VVPVVVRFAFGVMTDRRQRQIHPSSTHEMRADMTDLAARGLDPSYLPCVDERDARSPHAPQLTRGTSARRRRAVVCRAVQVLNFYSTIFADQLKRGRKTATIRLGDKSHKYRKNQAILVTIGYQHSPREKVFLAVIDSVEVKRVKELSPRDIEHDNPEFRRTEEMVNFLEQIYGRDVSLEDTVTVVRFSQIIENPPSMTERMHGIGGAQN
jgi:uncharacterized protein YqfB (UPF0267 family)